MQRGNCVVAAHDHTVISSRPNLLSFSHMSVAWRSIARVVIVLDSKRRPASKPRLSSMLKIMRPSLLLRYRMPCVCV